ncbi:MAG: InlB B-repeat-containing protein [Christensenellales bacterium]
MREKQLRKNILVFVLLTICAVMFVLGVNWPQPAEAAASDGQIAHLTEDKYAITNEAMPNGIDITRYADDYYAKNVYTDWGNNKKIFIQDSDAIEQIIPSELFKSEGKTLHIGKEYGFFIDCRNPVSYSTVLLSTVIIIKLDYNNDMLSAASHLKFKLCPIFQADFAYVTTADKKTYGIEKQEYNFFKDNYTYDVNLNFLSDKEEFIIPVPTVVIDGFLSVPELRFVQHNRYYLTNPSALVSLYNINQLNQAAYNYVEEEDDGCFFSQTDFSYEGRYLKKGHANWDEASSLAYSMTMMGFDLYDDIIGLGSVFKMVPVVNYLVTTKEIIDSIEIIDDKFKDVDVTEQKHVSYVANCTNADQQIAMGGLYKDAVIAVTSDVSEKQLLFGTNDYFEFDYQLVTQDINVDTYYAVLFNIGVVSVVNTDSYNTVQSEEFTTSSSFTSILKNHTDSEYKEVPAYTSENGVLHYNAHVLPNYYNLMQFTPDISGKYNIISDSNKHLGFEIYEANIVDGRADYNNLGAPIYSSISRRNAAEVTGAYLSADKTYFVKTDMKYTFADDGIIGYWGNFSLDFSFEPDTLTFGNNLLQFHNTSSEIFRVDFEDYYWYNFEADVSGAIFEILDSSYNAVETIGTDGFEAGGKNIFYIKVSIPEKSESAVNILCTRKRLVEYIYGNGLQPYSYWSIDGQFETLPENLTRDGFTFDSWRLNDDINKGPVTDEMLPELNLSTVTLSAFWQPISYTVSFEENGGNPVDDLEYTFEMSVALPGADQMQRSGYIFVGWYTDPDFDSEVWTSIPLQSTGDRIFYAAWAKETSTITLQLNTETTGKQVVELVSDGQIVDSNVYTFGYGEAFILPEAVSRGFDFDGWLYNGELIETGQAAHYLFWDDVVLTPKFTPVEFSIKLIDNGEGGQNVYWLVLDAGGNVALSQSEVFNTYNLNLCPDHAITAYRELHPESKLFFRDGLIYKNLTLNYIPPGNPNGEVPVYACWEQLSQIDFDNITYYTYYGVEKYNISINGTEAFYSMGDVITFPQMELENGYVLTWEYGRYSVSATDSNRNFTVPDLTPDLELDIIINPSIFNLVKTPIEYNINYSLSAGEVFENDQIVLGTYTIESPTYVLPGVLKEHYVFMGWRDEDGNAAEAVEHGSFGNLTFYPIFEPYVYTITYVANSGKLNGYQLVGGNYMQNYTVESATINLPVPVRDHYNFKGWFTNSALTASAPSAIPTGSYGNKTFYAKWESKIYTLYFSSDDGYSNSITAAYGQTVTLLSLSREFHTGQWRRTSDNSMFNFGAHYVCAGTATFKAVFTVIDGYFYKTSARDGTFTIEDKGQFNNSCDYTVTIASETALYYSKVRIAIYFTAWEKDDGYQHVYIYNGGSSSATQLAHWEFEHGGSRKDGNPAEYVYEVEVPISQVSGKEIYVRYDASGAFGDTWYNNAFGCEVFLLV